nr:Retrovirus-related Pol polyprotein from transposon TNT 1-94 [Ipomoea batatas]
MSDYIVRAECLQAKESMATTWAKIHVDFLAPKPEPINIHENMCKILNSSVEKGRISNHYWFVLLKNYCTKTRCSAPISSPSSSSSCGPLGTVTTSSPSLNAALAIPGRVDAGSRNCHRSSSSSNDEAEEIAGLFNQNISVGAERKLQYLGKDVGSENFFVRFNGKNYSAWAFPFELFVKGKELWSHISDCAPDKEKEKEKYAKWEVKDAQIMSWILGSVEPSILLSLKPYKTSRGMWDYLKNVYNQSNSAQRFQLELKLSQLNQGSMSIQEFYSSFETLWTEYTNIVYANVPSEGLVVVLNIHETSKRDQFLMKLRGEFETIRSNLMNRQLVPSMNICVGELLREEQRLTTMAVLEQKAQNSAPIPVAYAAQRRSNGGRDMTNVQCYSCKNFGHFANNCTKKFCNYCKEAGHIIKECSIRPPKKHETAYNVSVGPSSVSNAGQSTITPEMVQQMIVSALSAFGLSGNNTSDSKPWYFDSGASHHMTNTALPLKNVQKYSGDLQIHTTDGNSLPITAVDDISASLNNVFVSPKLSTNLISVGQLVDNNCTVQFSKSGCFVQDQVSRKMIAKGPKVGRLFPLFLSLPPVSNYVACNAVQSLTMASSHQPATTDSVPPSSSNPTPLRRSSRPHKPVERKAKGGPDGQLDGRDQRREVLNERAEAVVYVKTSPCI